MKAVLISIQPKWCELIASGQKTIEVRKSKPKLEAPFKVYIYCTQGDALATPCLNAPRYSIHRTNNGAAKGRRMTAAERMQSDHLYANGKIIGEFICEKVEKFVANCKTTHLIQTEQIAHSACIPMDKLVEYGYKSFHLYAWYISDLVMYEKPKPLSELKSFCKCYYDCDGSDSCKYYIDGSGYEYDESDCGCNGLKSIEKPPQSWCYVEELT